MQDNNDNSISFVWWNTGLSPNSSKDRATPEDRKIAGDIIEYLIKIKCIDFIALGEISEADKTYFEENYSFDGYEYKTGISPVGRSNFNKLYLYNSFKMEVSDPENIVFSKNDKNYRIAQRLDVITSISTKYPLHIYASHWPSRISHGEETSERHSFAMCLRGAIDTLINQYETTDPYIVLLGDYNDEPFNKPISDQLMGSRDIELVLKKNSLLYNPFWGYMSSKSNGAAGSYFYKNGNYTKWHTFDQILFSHAFIEAKEWKYSSEYEHIIDIPDYIEYMKKSTTIFDHLPVAGQIEKV